MYIGLKLKTNYGEFVIMQHPTLEEMSKYITREYNNGRKIEDIVFSVTPLRATNAREVIGQSGIHFHNMGF